MMDNYMMIEGKRIDISDETAENLKKQFVKKVFEKQKIGCHSFVEVREEKCAYPIRLSCIGRWGKDENDNDCAGDILSVYRAEKLIEVLQEAIKFVKEN